MNWRTTIVLAAIAMGVFVYLKFFELKQPGTGEARRQAQNVVNFDRDKIDGIVILNGDEKIELRRRDNRWRLETPIKDQADSFLIENLLSDLGNWQKEGTISAKEIDADKSKLSEYGLNKPRLRLKLLGPDKPPARSHSLVRRTRRGSCSRSAAFRRSRRTKSTCGSHRADSFTRCRRRSKRFSIQNQTICATVTWFGSTQTFLIGSRSMPRAEARPFLRGKMTTGQSPAATMSRQIQARSAVLSTLYRMSG